MARTLFMKWVVMAAFLTSVSSCGLFDHKEGGTEANPDSNSVLAIAPYQNSAVTLVSPDGKNTKAATFQKFTGSLSMKKNIPSDLKFSIQTNSLATSDKKLVSVLGSKEFFDSEKFPVAVFQSTDIKKNATEGSQPNSYVVDGNLDFRGEKIKMSVPVSLDMSDKEVSMMLQLSISQKDWMEKMKTSPDAFFKDHMEIVAKLVFPKPVKETPVSQTIPSVEAKKTPVATTEKSNALPLKEEKAASNKKVEKPLTEKKGQ